MPERRAVSSPPAADDVEVYAEGVRLMKERSAKDQMDPIGWWYQSRIHGDPAGAPWKPGEPNDWSQCRHGTWFFLPWHRIYLLQFERIIRALTGVADWGLPYWDYGDSNDAQVPPAFADTSSPLYESTRTLVRPTAAAPTWQQQATFVAFGGAPQESPDQYHHGRFPGQLELNPHNLIHLFVGGDMATFQSPLDPIFWIHHCNIDRYWEIWLALGHTNPVEDEWLNTTFELPDPDPKAPRRTTRLRDIQTVAAAGYSYDDLTPPHPVVLESRLVRMAASRRDDRLELIGASPGGSVRSPRQLVELDGPAVEHRLLAAAADAETAAATGLFLRLENVGIDGSDERAVWNVYVRTGENGDRHLAGTIAPFGLAGLTASGGRQTITFDISHLAPELVNEGPGPIEVTYEPARADVEGEPYWERVALYTTAG